MGRKAKGKRAYGLPKDGDPMHVFHLDSLEATRLKKPRYNAYRIGYGVHGDTSYNRRKAKREFLAEIDEERFE